jgi:hypothetical protein
MANEEFINLLLKLAPTPFLLYFSTEKNWAKIQKKGLEPQENRLKDYYNKPLPDQVIWLGVEPVEVYVNKDNNPLVIAIPINNEKFGLQETIPSAEYIAEKRILPEDFLGVFDFTQYQNLYLEERAFVEWLEKMGLKSSFNHKTKTRTPTITTERILYIISDQWLTNSDIGDKLGIDNTLDEKYLKLKLKELNRKKRIVYGFYYEQVYWKKNNSESNYELEISFTHAILEEDPFNADMLH